MSRILALLLAGGLTLAPLGLGATPILVLKDLSTTVALTTQLQNIPSGSFTPNSALIPNTVGTGMGGGLFCTIETFVTFPANPTAGSSLDIWLLKATDGTNIEDNTTQRSPDVVLPLNTTQVSTRVAITVDCPRTSFVVRARNTGSGQTTTAAGAHTLTIKAQTLQLVEG